MRPNWRPRTTCPPMAYGRPNRRVACAKSPPCKALRMRVLDTRSPSASTGSIACALKPKAAPMVCSSFRSPPRACPKRKSGPTHTSRAAKRCTSTLRTKSCADSAVIALLKRSKPTWSQPKARKPSALPRGSIKRAGGVSLAKNSRGSGSKLSPTAATPKARARATARPTSARWPTCRPSKAPMQTTLPWGHTAGPATSRKMWLMFIRKYSCGAASGALRGALNARGNHADESPAPASPAHRSVPRHPPKPPASQCAAIYPPG